ncbi:hypothetical protein CMU19_04495 [Elizabethkingia anophelis]|nr:hypothetical protein [Elizabethkingia anophelis]
MALGLTKTSGTPAIPIYQKVLETARGGFKLDVTGLTAGTIIKAGTPIAFDESTRLAKKAKVTTGASDAKGLLYEDVVVGSNSFVDVVTRGTVYENRIPTVEAEHKTALPLIIFSKSF